MISFICILGAVIIFTALLSVAFLGSTIRKVMWAGIFVILVGLALVGVSDIIFGSDSAQTDTNGIIAGKGDIHTVKKYTQVSTGLYMQFRLPVFVKGSIFMYIPVVQFFSI